MLSSYWLAHFHLMKKSAKVQLYFGSGCGMMKVFTSGIFKPLWRPGIDAKASIPPAYVAWRAGTITLFLLSA
jgi:hypothetical protein